jgi:hypothetical protein
MPPLDSVEVEFGEDANGFGTCFRNDFIREVIAEGKKRCEVGYHERVRGANATHDDGGISVS